MRTSYRDIFPLACCQALPLVNTSGLIMVNGLAGYSLAGDKAFRGRRHCRRFSRPGSDSLGILVAVMGVSSFASGVLIAAARWGRVNAVAPAFTAVVSLATAWLAALRERPATSRPPRRGW